MGRTRSPAARINHESTKVKLDTHIPILRRLVLPRHRHARPGTRIRPPLAHKVPRSAQPPPANDDDDDPRIHLPARPIPLPAPRPLHLPRLLPRPPPTLPNMARKRSPGLLVRRRCLARAAEGTTHLGGSTGTSVPDPAHRERSGHPLLDVCRARRLPRLVGSASEALVDGRAEGTGEEG